MGFQTTMAKRNCKYCNATTTQPLSDFSEIGWEAVSFNGRKAVCACPEHAKKLEEDMQNALVRSSVEQFHEVTNDGLPPTDKSVGIRPTIL